VGASPLRGGGKGFIRKGASTPSPKAAVAVVVAYQRPKEALVQDALVLPQGAAVGLQDAGGQAPRLPVQLLRWHEQACQAPPAAVEARAEGEEVKPRTVWGRLPEPRHGHPTWPPTRRSGAPL